MANEEASAYPLIVAEPSNPEEPPGREEPIDKEELPAKSIPFPVVDVTLEELDTESEIGKGQIPVTLLL